MNAIYRFECPKNLGEPFDGPDAPVTFAYQTERRAFSLWYESCYQGDGTKSYLIVGTGHEYPDGHCLVASCVMPDGFHVFHLLRKLSLAESKAMPCPLPPEPSPAPSRPGTEEVCEQLSMFLADKWGPAWPHIREAIRRVRAWEKARAFLASSIACGDLTATVIEEALALLDGAHDGGTA